MLALVTLGAVLSLSSSPSSSTSPRLSDDPVLRDVEQAFGILRANRPGAAGRARAHLTRVAAVLDDLDPTRSDVARVVAGDGAAPWRGLPHERVLALLTLAALDVDAGRCDLALPTLKNAEHHQARAALAAGVTVAAAADANADLVLADVLRLRCAHQDGADAAIDANHAAIRNAVLARPGGARLASAAIGKTLDLVFRGHTPTIEATGANGEQAVLRHHDDSTVAFVIRLGSSARRGRAVAEPKNAAIVWDAQTQARGPGPASSIRRQEKARNKQALGNQSTTWASQGSQAAVGARTSRDLLGAALLLSASAGAAASNAVVDAAVDTRVPPSMPAQVWVATGP
jgi:hypothetical protein